MNSVQSAIPVAIVLRSPIASTEWDAYYLLRYQILREPWNPLPGSEKLIDDGNEGVFHVAAYDQQGKTLGVGRLQKNTANVGQIRCVAISVAAQGQGIGKK